MNCTENRELHSALLDGELTPEERAQVETHLAGCPECSGEFERLARMLGVLHALPPDRAPIAFVDRVLASVRPVPWYARLGRGLREASRVRLPLQAAAVVIVALGALYVFQHSPELRQAARNEAPPVSSRAQAPAPAATTPARPAELEGARTADVPKAQPRAEAKEEDTAVSRDATAKSAPAATPNANAMKDGPPPVAASAPAAPPQPEPTREKKAQLERREQSAASRQDAQPAPAQPAAPADQRQRLGAAAPARAFVAPDVSGRLVVSDRAAAEAALADLRNRLGVAEAFRRDGGDGRVVMELVVPREAYGDLSRGLEGIGRWMPDREPPAPPPTAQSTPSPIRLQITLEP
jgi:hypothetical protein